MSDEKPVILPRDKIPFGHWGIITEEAFAQLVGKEGLEHAVRKIFQKRWDPLTTMHITLAPGASARQICRGIYPY